MSKRKEKKRRTSQTAAGQFSIFLIVNRSKLVPRVLIKIHTVEVNWFFLNLSFFFFGSFFCCGLGCQQLWSEKRVREWYSRLGKRQLWNVGVVTGFRRSASSMCWLCPTQFPILRRSQIAIGNRKDKRWSAEYEPSSTLMMWERD